MTSKQSNIKLSVALKSKEMICPNCGDPVARSSPKGPAPKFCSSHCSIEHSTRRAKEGAAIISLAKAWRVNRGQGPVAQEAFKQLTSALDIFNSDDRIAGRPRADLFAAKLMSDGRLPIDRLRR